MKTLLELAVEYQKTGELPDELAQYQLDFVLENVQELYEEYSSYTEPSLCDFQEFVIIAINDWLVENGFAIDVTNDEMIRYMEDQQEQANEDGLDEMLKIGDDDDKDTQLN